MNSRINLSSKEVESNQIAILDVNRLITLIGEIISMGYYDKAKQDSHAMLGELTKRRDAHDADLSESLRIDAAIEILKYANILFKTENDNDGRLANNAFEFTKRMLEEKMSPDNMLKEMKRYVKSSGAGDWTSREAKNYFKFNEAVNIRILEFHIQKLEQSKKNLRDDHEMTASKLAHINQAIGFLKYAQREDTWRMRHDKTQVVIDFAKKLAAGETSLKNIAEHYYLNNDQKYDLNVMISRYNAGDEDRLVAEHQRAAIEREKIAAEKERVAAEKERIAAEKERMAAEKERAAAEKERIAAEKIIETMLNINPSENKPSSLQHKGLFNVQERKFKFEILDRIEAYKKELDKLQHSRSTHGWSSKIDALHKNIQKDYDTVKNDSAIKKELGELHSQTQHLIDMHNRSTHKHKRKG